MQKRPFRFSVLVLPLAVAVMAGTLARGVTEETYPSLGVLSEALRDIETDYVTEVPVTQLVHNAVVGMLDDLDGKSELIVPPRIRDDAGNAATPGLALRRRKDILAVLAPIDGTPAQRAGVVAGDRILEIDGVETRTMAAADAVARLRGPAGTTVKVRIMRPGWAEPRNLTLERELLGGPTVSTQTLRPGVRYLRVHRFARQTSEDLTAALSELGGGGLILDLRNDPGGSVRDAVDLAQRFLAPGQLVAYGEGRRGGAHREFRASPSAGHFEGRLVVVANEGSGAAAEIAAAALHDWGRAVIVGTRTAGEASVQSTIPLPDGSAVRLTTGRYFTPRDHVIDAEGVIPDIDVRAAPPADTQLERAIEVLTIEQTIQKRAAAPAGLG